MAKSRRLSAERYTLRSAGVLIEGCLTSEGSFCRDYDMKKASIAKLKVNLSRYLDQVKRGESILVIERKQPVAMIVPVSSTGKRLESDNDRLARLERNGLIRRGTPGRSKWLLKRRPIKVTGSVLQDLLDERANGW